MKTEVIFVRHGATASNSHGILHGRTDVPLSDHGEVQARRVARRLAELNTVDSIVSSPLRRARITAEHIARPLGHDVRIEPRLSEFDFGDLEGLAFEELQANHPELYLSLIDRSGFDKPFPNGESRSALHDRVTNALYDGISEYQGGRFVVVAHLMVIAASIANLTSGDPEDLVRYLVSNCSITTVDVDPRGRGAVRILNDVSHLEEITRQG